MAKTCNHCKTSLVLAVRLRVLLKLVFEYVDLILSQARSSCHFTVVIIILSVEAWSKGLVAIAISRVCVVYHFVVHGLLRVRSLLKLWVVEDAIVLVLTHRIAILFVPICHFCCVLQLVLCKNCSSVENAVVEAGKKE